MHKSNDIVHIKENPYRVLIANQNSEGPGRRVLAPPYRQKLTPVVDTVTRSVFGHGGCLPGFYKRNHEEDRPFLIFLPPFPFERGGEARAKMLRSGSGDLVCLKAIQFWLKSAGTEVRRNESFAGNSDS